MTMREIPHAGDGAIGLSDHAAAIDMVDPIQAFYEKFPHPGPAAEIPAGIFTGEQTLESCPSRFFHLYWPQRERHLDLDILVAGCGTRQAALYGASLPEARIVAIDVSSESLAIQRAL